MSSYQTQKRILSEIEANVQIRNSMLECARKIKSSMPQSSYISVAVKSAREANRMVIHFSKQLNTN